MSMYIHYHIIDENIQIISLIKYGRRFITINETIKKLTYFQTFFTFLSSLIIYVKPTSNILPPSTGPSGSRLNNPMPNEIIHNQLNNSNNQMNIEVHTFEMFLSYSVSCIVLIPITYLPSSNVGVIVKFPLSVLIINVSLLTERNSTKSFEDNSEFPFIPTIVDSPGNPDKFAG